MRGSHYISSIYIECHSPIYIFVYIGLFHFYSQLATVMFGLSMKTKMKISVYKRKNKRQTTRTLMYGRTIIFSFELFIDGKSLLTYLNLGHINAMLQCCICDLLKVLH